MQFAINYSPQADALLTAGKVTIDLFKCPDWENLVALAEQHKPVYIHFPIVLGRDKVKTLDFAAIERWLSRTQTRYVNSHLEALQPYFPPDVTQNQVLDAVLPEVELLVRHFGPERVIVENVPYTRSMIRRGLLPVAIEPEVIYTTVETAGCGFLLDVSHAALSCESTGREVYDYLEKLPVHRLRELHVTGLGYEPDGTRTDHLPLLDSDWQRLEWVLERIRSGAWPQPDTLAFEYGGIGPTFEWRSESSVIEAQVPRLFRMCHAPEIA